MVIPPRSLLPPPLVRLKEPEIPAAPPVPIPWRVKLVMDILAELPTERRQAVATEIVRALHVARKPVPADPAAVTGREEPAWRLYDDGKRTLEVRRDPLAGFMWRWQPDPTWRHASHVAAALTAARLPARYRTYFVEPA